MRVVFAVPVAVLLIAAPSLAWPAQAQTEAVPPAQTQRPGISPSAATDRNEAEWADLEAQARMTDGDYDGALQAEKQAQIARSRAAQQELAARTTSKRP